MTELFRVAIDWGKPEVVLETSWYCLVVLILLILLVAVSFRIAVRRCPVLRGLRPGTELKVLSVAVKLGGVEVKGQWEPAEREREASWELYVELVTRIAVQELPDDQGLMREALSSLHSLFQTTRDILRKYGPSVAMPTRKGHLSFGFLAIAVLNRVLRPVLATWHPLLSDHEGSRPQDIGPAEWERLWNQHGELRSALKKVRADLREYESLLREAANVPLVVTKKEDSHELGREPNGP